jgi:zinc transporter ZupT
MSRLPTSYSTYVGTQYAQELQYQPHDASNFVLAFVQAFAGGAILMMLANTMIPEAYERAGKLAGMATVIGFAVAVVVVVLEHTGVG